MNRRGWAARLGVLAAALVVVGPAAPLAAETYVTINGAGSTWSQIAIDDWRADVAQFGLTVNYAGTGSTDGRRQYIQGTAEWAVSEVPFQTGRDGGRDPEDPSRRPHAYLPIVAGGTSFMYHITVAGQRVTDLRLSGETITKIFTGEITNWNDPQVTRDYGKALPSIPIQPVVRSDGSGTSAQFTAWMASEYPDLWNSFCGRSGLPVPCGATSFYPQFPGSTSQAQSNGVANYVAASFGEGAINYVEYAYALNLSYPVVKVLNNAGYYALPTASNVAVALLNARINDDLTQVLTDVYNNPDSRTYPLSSYSYMIVPIDTTFPMTTEKGTSLSTYINYFLCEGQGDAEDLGYSPLPINLVQAGFEQVRRIPGFVAPPTDLAACNNPTFQNGQNVLLQTAPQPSECDKLGSPIDNCDPAVPGGGGGETGGGATGGAGSGSNGGAAGPGAVPGGSGADPGASGGGAAAPGVDPETGLPLPVGDGAANSGGLAVGTPQTLGAFGDSGSQTRVIYGLTALELLLAVTLPPLIAGWLRRRRSSP